MPPQQPTDLDPTTPPAVIEFGPGDDPAGAEQRPARRRRLAGFGWSLIADPRLVPLAAVLAAVAAFASLVSEWQTTTVNAGALGNGELGDKMLPADLADLGAFGGGYLAGLFLLVATMVLTLFGPPAGRRYARLTGLAVGGALLGVLLSLTALLGDQSRIFSRLYTLELSPDELKIAYGRGLWCALAGVLLALAALFLAGRRIPAAPAGGEPADSDPAGQDEPGVVWSWRRPQDVADAPEEPFDLTVSAATPFTSRTDEHDRPAG